MGQLSSPLRVLVGKVPYANMANGLYCEAADINSSRDNGIVCLRWTRRCVRERARQWQPEPLQTEQTLHRMLCQVISPQWAFLRTEALCKSPINDWNKQTNACSEGVSVCTVAEWFHLLWLETLKVWLRSFSLKRHCLSSKCENVFMLQCGAAIPLIIFFPSLCVCLHCLPLTCSLG